MVRRPKTSDQTEHYVKEQVKKILGRTEWKFWMPAAGVFGLNGVSDFLCIKQPKLFMAIETKYDDVVTAQQFKFLTTVHDAGHYAFLVDETNVSELPKLLANLENDASIPQSFLKWQTQNPIMDMRILKTLTSNL